MDGDRWNGSSFICSSKVDQDEYSEGFDQAVQSDVECAYEMEDYESTTWASSDYKRAEMRIDLLQIAKPGKARGERNIGLVLNVNIKLTWLL
jgi:hypothetical protein